VRAATCELLNRYIHIRVRTSRKTLLSVAVLLKAGFDVKFVTGTKKDPTFGGYLVTPDGQKIRMIFGDNLWRLPMWSDPVRYINDETSPVNREMMLFIGTRFSNLYT